MGAVWSALKRAVMTLAMIGGGTGAAIAFDPELLKAFPQVAPALTKVALLSGVLWGAFKGGKEFFKKSS